MTDVLDRPARGEETGRPVPASPAPAFSWHGGAEADGAGTLRLLRDAIFTLATLGLYRCWQRTAARRRVWSGVRLDGVPLRYTGTVRDLVLPTLAVLGGLLAVALAIWIAKLLAVPRPRITPSPWRFVVTVPLIYVLGLAAWRQRAFLVEHTAIGRLTGRLEGSRHAYALRHFLTALAVPLTLGWVVPFRQVMLHTRLIEGMRLGAHCFACEGDARLLLPRFGVAWLGAIAIYLAAVLSIAFSSVGRKIAWAKAAGRLPVLDAGEVALAAAIVAAAAVGLGLLVAWYRVGVWRRMAAWTSLDGRPLRLEVGTRDYLAFAVGNMALRSGTLGLLSAVAEERQARFLLSRLRCA